MQFWRDDYGTVIAIGIESDNKEEIQYTYYSFWNHGATSGDLMWISERFAYFWTNPDNLQRCLVRRALFKLLNISQPKGKRGGLMPEAIELAAKDYGNIRPLSFISTDKTWNIKPYKVGYLEFNTIDLAYL